MPQKNWDKYEVALLIEAYQNIKKGRVDKNTALVALSQNLRQIAKNEGLEIDDTFRNMNGMQWQLGFIERAFIGEDYESRTPPKIFMEMVAVYNKNQQEFQAILEEAHQKITGGIEVNDDVRKEQFKKWLADNSNISPISVVDNVNYVSTYANKRNIAKKSFWSFTDYKEFNIIRVKLSGNKLFKLMHGKEHRQFEKNGKLYSDFLKEQFKVTEKKQEEIKGVEPITDFVDNENDLSQDSQADTATVAIVADAENVTNELAGAKEDLVLAQYSLWLLQERNLSAITSRSYVSNLRIANIRVQERGLLNGSLFDIEDADLQEAVKRILSDSNFSKYNSEQHNRFSASLQAYLLFKIGEKAKGVRTRKTRKYQETVICSDELKELLLKKFPYGIRVESSIDMMKLENFAEMFEVALPKNEEQLKAQISAEGIDYEGKKYFISDEVFDGIIEKINHIFAEGYGVIYYEELFGKNFEWFDENHISSWELVRGILDKRSEKMYVSKNFLRQSSERINEADAVEQELERVWGEEVIHTYDEMYVRLPYIPNDKVRFYLSRCKKFVWSTHETFAWIDKVIISEDEKQAIIDYVTNECELVGHASIANVPLGNIEEENYQISITAIYDAIYNLMLKEKFAINGKILTKINSEIDALTLAKAYCTGKEICSFAELNDYVTSINGTANRQITFCAAYDQMVRVEENKFVADKSVNFDIDAIDELLEEIISGDFASIKSVATFIMFPYCGFTWTHYLIESFCYRFSKRFRLEVINFNDKNAGIIAKKEVELSFADMLAFVAANSGLELNAEIIGQYLYDNGYVARRKMPLIDNAVEKAKLIREGR